MNSIPNKRQSRARSVKNPTVSDSDTIVAQPSAQPSAQSLPNRPLPDATVAELDGGEPEQSPNITDASLHTEPASPPLEVENPDPAEPTGLNEGSIPPPDTASVSRAKLWKKKAGENEYTLDFKGRETLTHQDCMELVASVDTNGKPACYLTDGTITQISKWEATCKILNFLLTKLDDIGEAVKTNIESLAVVEETGENNAEAIGANKQKLEMEEALVDQLQKDDEPESDTKLSEEDTVEADVPLLADNTQTPEVKGEDPNENPTEENPDTGLPPNDDADDGKKTGEDATVPDEPTIQDAAIPENITTPGKPDEKGNCDCTDEKNAAYAQGLEEGKNVVTNIPEEKTQVKGGATSVAERIQAINDTNPEVLQKNQALPQLSAAKKYQVSFL